MVGYSFVQTPEDMQQLVWELAAQRRAACRLSPRSRPRAVRNLPEIILGTIGRTDWAS